MRVFSFFTIFIVSCSQTELIPVTAESLGKKISSYKGDKAVLVNIWALWCDPCIEEFPMIVNFQKDTKDLEVIFVSADFKDQSRDVVKFLNHYDIGLESYIKSQKDEAFINGIHNDWSGSLPFTIVYAKKSGKIIDYWEGKRGREKFSEVINLAIGL